ncbi:SAM-dependent methyltransferase [Salibaculum griseiflavum]|uniref:SAM-dependent methyltransferase n=2 Tax=Salibaculum griseiflavum TaxID=1914409 RepID=A0A2V1NZD8_9RHOB|nr:SAM-dependent methyltransferase [Salibaculum griseiflavum]
MWEDRYHAEGDYLFGRAPAAFLTDNPWIVSGMQTALCVADGEGRNSVWLAGQGLKVSAFDLSPTAIARAQALAADAGVRVATQVSDWAGYDWERQVDMVVGIFVQFMGAQDRPGQFADMARALRPGGRLVLHGYRPEQVDYGTGGPPSRDNMYTEALLREAFPGWQVERLASYDRDVDEGRGHSGRSALIDLVARKPG